MHTTLRLLLLALVPVAPLATPRGVSPPTPVAWVWDRTPPETCGRPIRIAAAVPRPLPGDSEAIALVNPGPGPLSLHRFELRAGRRRVRLPDVALGPGAGVALGAETLGTFRLRNDGGELVLIDPCGAETDAVAWGETAPGDVLWAADLAPRGPRTLPWARAHAEPVHAALAAEPSPDTGS
jgi:hypothetical protein